jgi:hypothetical protein
MRWRWPGFDANVSSEVSMRQFIIAAFCACTLLGAGAHADEVTSTVEAPVTTSSTPTDAPTTAAPAAAPTTATALPAEEPPATGLAPSPARPAPGIVAGAELSEDDLYVLRRREIGPFAYVVGGLAATYPGFGLGHIIQGRYVQKGRLFMRGEIVGAALMLIDAFRALGSCGGDCSVGPLFYGGAATFVVFKVWEVVDAWGYPPRHNERYLELQQQRATGMSLAMPKPLVLPSAAFAMPESAPPVQFAIGF